MILWCFPFRNEPYFYGAFHVGTHLVFYGAFRNGNDLDSTVFSVTEATMILRCFPHDNAAVIAVDEESAMHFYSVTD